MGHTRVGRPSSGRCRRCPGWWPAGRCAERDFADWQQARLRDEALIKRWDATSELTWEQRHSRAMWHSHRSLLRVGARRGEVVPFAITVDGAFAGQVTLGGIQRGALRSAWVGYWVDSRFHGKGVATAAVALIVAHAFGPVGLHRVEATISPHNLASRAVVDHLGFRAGGGAAALPGHRRRLAGPPALRAHRGGGAAAGSTSCWTVGGRPGPAPPHPARAEVRPV